MHPSADRSQSNDGCDAIALYVDTAQVSWASARMHAFMLSAEADHVVALESCRKGIGYTDTPEDYQWQRYSAPLQRGDTFLLVSDGATDQPGGPRHHVW